MFWALSDKKKIFKIIDILIFENRKPTGTYSFHKLLAVRNDKSISVKYCVNSITQVTQYVITESIEEKPVKRPILNRDIL